MINLKNKIILILVVFLSVGLIVSSVSLGFTLGNTKNNLLGDGFYTLTADPSIESLSDVNISGLSTDDILQYDGSEWVNTALAAGSMTTLPETYTYVGNSSNVAVATSTLNIQSNGFIGMGKTPSYRLDVNGIIRTDNAVIFGAAGVGMRTSGGVVDFAGGTGYGSGFKFNTGGVTSGAMTILNAGNVGIGSTTPFYKLSVDGIISATGGISTDWNTAYSWGNHALGGYLKQAYASSTYAIAGGAYHDDFSDFVANEHIDWTADQGATNIHAGNYTDTNTTYTAGGTLLDLTGTTFSLDEGTLTNGKICTYVTGTGIVCNTDAGATEAFVYATLNATTTLPNLSSLPKLQTYPAFSIASTTWNGIAGLTASSTIQLKPAYTAETWAGIRCLTDTATALIKIGDGTNFMTTITASSTAGLITVSTNNTFTAGEPIKAVVSNIGATVNWISCSLEKKNE